MTGLFQPPRLGGLDPRLRRQDERKLHATHHLPPRERPAAEFWEGTLLFLTWVASSATICCSRIQKERAPLKPAVATLTASSGRPER